MSGSRGRLSGAILFISMSWLCGPSFTRLVAEESSKGKGAADAKKADAAKPAEKSAAKAKPKSGPGVEWLSLELGLVQVRQKRLPALVLYDMRASGADAAPAGEPQGASPGAEPSEPVAKGAAAAPSGAPGFFDDHLADSGVKDVLKHFVLIRATAADLKKPFPSPPPVVDAPQKKGKEAQPPPKPPAGAGSGDGADAGNAPAPGADAQDGANLAATGGAKLGLGGERSALVAMSYWEEAVLSYIGELPTRTKVKNDLTRIWKVNKLYADEARRVEPEVEKSRYAAKLGNLRDAVLKVRDFEDTKVQSLFDPVLKKKVSEVIQDYRAKAQKAMSEGDKLDAAKQYTKAIEAFDKVISGFPFQDVMQQANKRKGECLRKLTFGG